MSNDWTDTPEGWHKREFLLVGLTTDFVQSLAPVATGLGVPEGWIFDHFDMTTLITSQEEPAWSQKNQITARTRAKLLTSHLDQWSVALIIGIHATSRMGFQILKWEDFDGTYVGAIYHPLSLSFNQSKADEFLSVLGIAELVKPGHKCWIPPDEVVWGCPFCGQDWANGQRHG